MKPKQICLETILFDGQRRYNKPTSTTCLQTFFYTLYSMKAGYANKKGELKWYIIIIKKSHLTLYGCICLGFERMVVKYIFENRSFSIREIL